MTQVVGLAEAPAVVGRMFEGKVRGRTVVDVNAYSVATVPRNDTRDTGA